jgi:hypothetical protein
MKETRDGTQTEAIDVPINVSDSMLFSCESDSNEIEESDEQSQKH